MGPRGVLQEHPGAPVDQAEEQDGDKVSSDSEESTASHVVAKRGRVASNFLLRRTLSNPGPGVPEWLRPPVWPCITWWTTILLNHYRPVIDQRAVEGLLRGLKILAICSGILSEAWASVALGIPVDSFTTCDSDEEANKFAVMFHKSRIAHSFNSMAAAQRSIMAGFCEKHQKYCVLNDPAEYDFDFVIGGPPCQPYSEFRKGADAVPPERRPLYASVFGDETVEGGSFLQLVRARKPRGGLLCGFASFVRSNCLF